jgi:LmbE family N-acetylglucosaminyl deacetylase
MENWFVPHHESILPVARRVMVFAPHPDDEVFGCAGAIIQTVRSGASIQVLVFTDGCAHLEGQAMQDMKALREHESCVSAQRMGCPEPQFLGFEDRKLCDVRGLKDIIRAKIEAFNPDLLFFPSFWEIHPDHRALCFATLEVAKEGFHGITSDLVLMQYEVGSPMLPNFILDITEQKNIKDAAVKAFESQLKFKSYDRCIDGLNRYRALTLNPKASFAEAYFLLHLKDLDFWLDRLRTQETPDFVFSMQEALSKAHMENLQLIQDMSQLKLTAEQDRLDMKLLSSKLESLMSASIHRQQKLDAILESWSWRVTEPLRVLGRLARRIRSKRTSPFQ